MANQGFHRCASEVVPRSVACVTQETAAAQRTYARIAGVMFFVVLAVYIAGLTIASAVAGDGSFAERAEKIIAAEPLYRLGLLLSLAGPILTLLLAVALYVAVRPVDRNLALAALLFRTSEAVIGAIGMVLAFAVLEITLGVREASAFDGAELATLTSLLSGAPSAEITALFFSLGSTIYFYLFLKSTYIPKALSALGLFGSLCYAAFWVAQLLAPETDALVLYASAPILLAELGTGLWLLIRGINTT